MDSLDLQDLLVIKVIEASTVWTDFLVVLDQKVTLDYLVSPVYPV